MKYTPLSFDVNLREGFACDLTRPDDGYNPFVASCRGDDDLEQSPLEPIASVARIAGYKKWFTGFEVMLCCDGKQSSRQMLRQTRQYRVRRLVGRCWHGRWLQSSSAIQACTPSSQRCKQRNIHRSITAVIGYKEKNLLPRHLNTTFAPKNVVPMREVRKVHHHP
jgi:hypothetical protein